VGIAVLSILSLPLAVAGIVALVVPSQGNGYINLGVRQNVYQTSGYALVTEATPSTELFGMLTKLKVSYSPVDSKGATFVGIAPARDVDSFLSGVQYTTVAASDNAQGFRYEVHSGQAPGTKPEDASIWTAESVGTSERGFTWTVRPGRYRFLAMNADGTKGVAGRVDVSAKMPALPWIGAVCLLVALGIAWATWAWSFRNGHRPRRRSLAV
jgi:hypothetical protein